MPQQEKRERKDLIAFLEKEILLDLIESDDESSDEDTSIDDGSSSEDNSSSSDDEDMTMELLLCVKGSRYLCHRTQVPKISFNVKLDLIKLLDNGRVKQEIRMDLSSFNKLHDMICVHPVFSEFEARRRTPIKVQMMVALERIGCYGNGVSVGKVARSAGISGK